MHVVVIDPDRIRAAHTALALSQIGQAHCIHSQEELHQLQRDVGRIDTAFVAAELGANFVQDLKYRYGLKVYVTGNNNVDLRAFYEAGAEEVVPLPLIREWLNKRFSNERFPSEGSAPTMAGSAFSQDKTGDEKANRRPPVTMIVEKATVIAIHSAKGGVGKSTLAINLGAYLAMQAQSRRVCLVDLDTNFGTISKMLQVSGHSVYDFATCITNSSGWNEVEKMLTPHSSGLYVLPGVKSTAEVAEMTENHELTLHVINVLRRFFDVLILDLSPGISSSTLAALEQANIIYELMTNDHVLTSETHKMIHKYLPEFGVDTSRIRVIVNRYEKQMPIGIRDIEQAFHVPVLSVIREDPRIRRHMGVWVTSHPRSDMGRTITEIMEELGIQPKPERRKLFRFSFLARKEA